MPVCSLLRDEVLCVDVDVDVDVDVEVLGAPVMTSPTCNRNTAHAEGGVMLR